MTALRVATVRRPKPGRSLIWLEEKPIGSLVIPEHLGGFACKELGTVTQQERRLRFRVWFSAGIHQHSVSAVDGRASVLVGNSAALVLVAIQETTATRAHCIEDRPPSNSLALLPIPCKF